MVHGDITKLDLGTASFERIITNNNFYVDKSEFIEHFLYDHRARQDSVRFYRLTCGKRAAAVI